MPNALAEHTNCYIHVSLATDIAPRIVCRISLGYNSGFLRCLFLEV